MSDLVAADFGPLLTRTAAPAALLTLAEIKAQCNIAHSDDDTMLGALGDAAAALLDGPDGMVGRALVSQEWTLQITPPSGRNPVSFPLGPLISLDTVSYYDADNASQTLDLADLTTYSSRDFAYVVPDIGTAWPAMYARPDALTLVFTCGHATVPANVLHAAKALVSHWYENRDAVNIGSTPAEVPMLVEALLAGYRAGWISA